MRKLIQNKTFQIGLFAFVLFWTIAAFAPFYELNEVIGGVLLGVGMVVVWTYGGISLEAIRESKGQLDRLGQLSLGITVTWIGVIIHRAYHLWWRVEGQPLGMINVDFVTFLIYLTILGGILHITAPATSVNAIPYRGARLLLAAVGGGALVAGFLIGAQWSGHLVRLY